MPDVIQPAAKDAHYFDSARMLDNLSKKVFRGTGINVFSQVISFALSIISISVIGRLLVRDDYGLVGMSSTWTAFANVIGNLGISAVVLQRPKISRAELSWLFFIAAGMGTAMTLISFVIAPLLGDFFREPTVSGITRVQGLGFAIVAFGSIHIALMQRAMEFRQIAIAGITSQAAGVAAGVALAYAGWGPWSLVYMTLTTNFLRSIVAWYQCPWRPSLQEKPEGLRSLLGFGWYVTMSGFTNYLSTNLDNILIGRFFGAGDLGLYRRAYSLLEYPTSRLLPAIRQVGDTALSRIQNEPTRFRNAATSMLHVYLLLGTPVVVVMMVGAYPSVRIIMGQRWEPAAAIFVYMMPLMWVRLTSSVGTMCFFASGQVKKMSGWNFVNCMFAVAAIVLGVPWGPIGVAASYAVTGVLIRIPYLFFCLRCIDGFRPLEFLKIQFVYGWLALASGLAAYLAVRWLTPQNDFVELLVVACSSLIVFWGLVFAIPFVRQPALDLVQRAKLAFRK